MDSRQRSPLPRSLCGESVICVDSYLFVSVLLWEVFRCSIFGCLIESGFFRSKLGLSIMNLLYMGIIVRITVVQLKEIENKFIILSGGG